MKKIKPEKTISINKELSKNHIEEYFSNKENNKEVLTSKELFKAEKHDVDIRTDIIWKEIILVNKLLYNNILLKKYKLLPVFEDFVTEYMRLKISMDRKSRTEFVDMNRARTGGEDALKGMSELSTIMNTKK
jgi:DNA replicative helicase MCM subunit Mcm2 (Cdc46/Mcm family)